MANDNRVRISAGVDNTKSITAPPEELDKWDQWAEELDMTRSKFIRCAVHAGVAKIDPPSFGQTSENERDTYHSEIKEAIQAGEDSADDIVEAVLTKIEDDIRDDLDQMLQTNRVQMDAREGLVLGDQP